MLTKEDRKKPGFSTRMDEKHTVYTKEKKNQMADLFVLLAEGFQEDTGNCFSCKEVQDFHCYYHFLAEFDVVLEQLHQQEVENRQDHQSYCSDYSKNPSNVFVLWNWWILN